MLDVYVKEKSENWIQQFSQKEWYQYSEDSYYAAREICNLIARILIRLHSGEDMDTAINRELDLLFEIKSPIMKRTQQIIIQNLVLSEDQILNFEEQALLVKGQEFRRQEGKIAKSCEIKDFILKFQFHLRRITPEEFEVLTYAKGLLADQMNISTCLEISYEFPNDRFEGITSESGFKALLAMFSVRDFIQQIIERVIIAIKFSRDSIYIRYPPFRSHRIFTYENFSLKVFLFGIKIGCILFSLENVFLLPNGSRLSRRFLIHY